jgi:hypothetical protein
MKELDRDSIELSKELRAIEQSYIQKLRSGGQEDRALLDVIELSRNKIKQKLSEKTAIGKNLLHELDRFTRKLDSDLAFFETDLKKYGGFEQAKKGSNACLLHFLMSHRLIKLVLRLLMFVLKLFLGIEAGSDVAIRPLLTSDEIILGRVTFYHIDIGAYDVADGDDSKRYHLPENQVAPLDMLYSQRRLTKGEEVLAIYPETTSFYPAYIVQAPRRTALGIVENNHLNTLLSCKRLK